MLGDFGGDCATFKSLAAGCIHATDGRWLMHARLMRFKIAADRRENLLEFRQQRIQKLKSLDGLLHVFDMISEDDEFLILAVYRDRKCAEHAATMKVAGEFWFKMGGLALLEEIDIRHYSVTHHDDMDHSSH
jgi:hypothetical protein